MHNTVSITTKIETNIQTDHFVQYTFIKYNTYHGLHCVCFFYKNTKSSYNKTCSRCGVRYFKPLFCVNLVNVEAVGGRRFEKMLQDMREVSFRFFLLYFIECFLTQTTIFLKSYHIFVLLKPRKA